MKFQSLQFDSINVHTQSWYPGYNQVILQSDWHFYKCAICMFFHNINAYHNMYYLPTHSILMHEIRAIHTLFYSISILLPHLNMSFLILFLFLTLLCLSFHYPLYYLSVSLRSYFNSLWFIGHLSTATLCPFYIHYLRSAVT